MVESPARGGPAGDWPGTPLGAGLLAHTLLRDIPQAASTVEQIRTGLDEDNTLRLTLPDWQE
ncbi:MAG: hypothetical protein R3C12_02315 [Planctomycetaceae bacterium]